MKRASTRALGAGFVVVAVLAVLANGAVAQPGGAGPGNSATAQLCHKGGWQGAVASDGAHFANAGECTSHAAQGGTLVTFQDLYQQACEDAGGTFTVRDGDWFCHSSFGMNAGPMFEICLQAGGTPDPGASNEDLDCLFA